MGRVSVPFVLALRRKCTNYAGNNEQLAMNANCLLFTTGTSSFLFITNTFPYQKLQGMPKNSGGKTSISETPLSVLSQPLYYTKHTKINHSSALLLKLVS